MVKITNYKQKNTHFAKKTKIFTFCVDFNVFASPGSSLRKIFFILKDYNEKRKETLGQYYLRTYTHLIPADVEILEYDERTSEVSILKTRDIY